MAALSPLEKLDTLLKIFVMHGARHDLISMQKIIDAKHIEINSGETNFILRKLAKDQYLDIKEIPVSNTENVDTYYTINFEGRVFDNEGGYVTRNSLAKSELNTTKVLNWAIAIGGGMAAVYYFLQILRNFIMPLFH